MEWHLKKIVEVDAAGLPCIARSMRGLYTGTLGHGFRKI
jgi:hypothetical protein